MFLQQKYKEYKEKNAREAWDKKLEKAAKKQFGLDDDAAGGSAKNYPASFLRRESTFKRAQGKNKAKLRLRGECALVTKKYGNLVKKLEWLDVILDRGMLLCMPLNDKGPSQADAREVDEFRYRISLGGSILLGKGKKGFDIMCKEYVDEETTWQKYKFQTRSAKETEEWMLSFSKVPALLRRLEDYFEVGNVIGEGGTALVRTCISIYTGKQFALKSVIDGGDVDRKGRENMHNELRILQMCAKDNHPSIPMLEDFFYDSDGNLFLVLELLTGGELLGRIVNEEVFTERDAQVTIKTVLEGVRYLHSKGIAHRDLKPENLVYSSQGQGAELKIIDYDLAKNLSGGTASTPCGTSHYMAPEIVGEYRHSLSVDLWSVGCIAYILLCGRYPFWAEDKQVRDALISSCSYEFDPKLWGGVSDTAKEFVSGLLQKQPHMRLTAHEALGHPWLLNIREEDGEEVPLPTISNYLDSQKNPAIQQLHKSFSQSIKMRRDIDNESGETQVMQAEAKKIAPFSSLNQIEREALSSDLFGPRGCQSIDLPKRDRPNSVLLANTPLSSTFPAQPSSHAAAPAEARMVGSAPPAREDDDSTPPTLDLPSKIKLKGIEGAGHGACGNQKEESIESGAKGDSSQLAVSDVKQRRREAMGLQPLDSNAENAVALSATTHNHSHDDLNWEHHERWPRTSMNSCDVGGPSLAMGASCVSGSANSQTFPLTTTPPPSSRAARMEKAVQQQQDVAFDTLTAAAAAAQLYQNVLMGKMDVVSNDEDNGRWLASST